MAAAKTNVMRILEQKKIAYTAHTYPHNGNEAVDGASIAKLTGQDPARVFKTLVTKGHSGGHFVMKKPFPTVLALQAEQQPTILVSGGKIGTQVEVAPQDLIKITGAHYADILA